MNPLTRMKQENMASSLRAGPTPMPAPAPPPTGGQMLSNTVGKHSAAKPFLERSSELNNDATQHGLLNMMLN